MEARGEAYVAAIRDGFLREAQQGDDSIRLIDADRPVHQIADTVAEHLRSRFARQLAGRG
jgi:hypothetical protein